MTIDRQTLYVIFRNHNRSAAVEQSVIDSQDPQMTEFQCQKGNKKSTRAGSDVSGRRVFPTFFFT